MTLVLHASPDSAGVIVRMFLEELGLACEDRFVDRSIRAHKAPAFLALNPQGLVPVLQDPSQDEPLFETAAILLHLTDRHRPVAGAAPGDPGRGRFLKWLFFLSNTLHADQRIAFYAQRYARGEAAVAEVRDAALDRVRGHFALLDRELARGAGPYLFGPEPGACDVYIGACVRWAQLYPDEAVIAPAEIRALPRLAAMVADLQQRPAVIRAYARDGIAPPLMLDPALPDRDPATVTG